ncbi:FAD-dependent oxidoreductase [Caballeronia sp. J97]|uniref:FAD-dependent oxidoreductase n=1 Tax=Caballeronia sp. J97 TaxID=2805429 RepID=UPI002AAF2FC4|nr:FAD-dependent oxidoreductase [Caballeronia sp. J97]
MYDAIVIGGGFYGTMIALYLRRQRGFADVLLIERESALLSRASYNNQARVHNGYHYPRSFTTAFRSRVNHMRFIRDYRHAVKTEFTSLYAIARNNSKVTSRQFQSFCARIGAELTPAPASLRSMFDPNLVEGLFVVQECVFDSEKLRAWAHDELVRSGVKVLLDTQVESVDGDTASLHARIARPNGHRETFEARYVINCTYSGLNQHCKAIDRTAAVLKHEITEMGLVLMPKPLRDLGLTVMDGPFFSVMPFPSRGLHTLSHVRYTPHVQWLDEPRLDPYAMLASYKGASRVDRMMRDVKRFMPMIEHASHVDSLFEVKTVLMKNEGDDGRPILFERHARLPNYYAILGGKIDNIYDVIEKLDAEVFPELSCQL